MFSPYKVDKFVVIHPDIPAHLIKAVTITNHPWNDPAHSDIELSVFVAAELPSQFVLTGRRLVNKLTVKLLNGRGDTVNYLNFEECSFINSTIDLDWSSDNAMIVKIKYRGKLT